MIFFLTVNKEILCPFYMDKMASYPSMTKKASVFMALPQYLPHTFFPLISFLFPK